MRSSNSVYIFAPQTNTKLSDIMIRDECVWHIKNLLKKIHTDGHLFVDLTPYLCRQRKWRKLNSSTSSQTRQLYAMCSLVNQHLKQQHTKATSVKDLAAHRHTHRLKIYAPTQRLREFHHHLRHSQPSKIFLQTKFPTDNWSAHWNLKSLLCSLLWL